MSEQPTPYGASVTGTNAAEHAACDQQIARLAAERDAWIEAAADLTERLAASEQARARLVEAGGAMASELDGLDAAWDIGVVALAAWRAALAEQGGAGEPA